MTAPPIPVVDVTAMHSGDDVALGELARHVGQICEEIGFFVIVGHGVSPAQIDAIDAQAREFFAQPLREKMRIAPDDPDVFRGYTPSAASALATTRGQDTPPDLCELFTMNRFDDPDRARRADRGSEHPKFFHPNLWPPEMPEFRFAFESYYATMEQLALDVMGLFALALELPHRWFDSYFDDHITNLVANFYPPQIEPPRPGQLRRGLHSDWGSLTLLYQDDAPGGLQVLTKADEWIDVPHIEGSYVVNLGDLMAFWTNDRWVSNIHRVSNPSRSDARTARLSIPFFHQPSFDAVITSIPSCVRDGEVGASTTSGEWILERLRVSTTLEDSTT